MTTISRVQEVKTYNVCVTWEGIDFIVTYDPLFDGTFFDDSTWTVTLNDEFVYGMDGNVLTEDEKQEIISAVRKHLCYIGVIKQHVTA